MTHVQIVSVGHSGSSLLNLVLGAHPSVLSVGEVWSLQEVWEREECACGDPLPECRFWSQVSEQVALDCGHSVDTLAETHPLRDGVLRRRRGQVMLWPSDLLVTFAGRATVRRLAHRLPTLNRSIDAALNNLHYLETASRLSRRSMIVDSSKNPLRARLLCLTDPERFRMIHMVRDGRAVANSWRKAYGMDTYRQAVVQWYLRDRLIHVMTRRIPKPLKYFIRYEDLCAHPESTIRGLCEFLGIGFDPRMLQFQACERHDVHINPRPLKSENRTITLDEKWTRSVSPEELKAFDRLAGRWNRKYGYTE